MHAELAASLKEPGAQLVHCDAPAGENVPCAHGMQVLLPARLKLW